MRYRPQILLLDFAGVVGMNQPERDRRRLVTAAGGSAAGSAGSDDMASMDDTDAIDGERFWAAYWRCRRSYDAGSVTAVEYWRAVAAALGRVEWPAARSRELTRLDVASWLHPNRAVLDIASDAASNGMRLAILSNAPKELADGIRALDWIAPFGDLVFSCDLGLTKPDPQCYSATLRLLRADAGDVLFVDDRQENVDGAIDAGLRAVVYRNAARLREAVQEHGPGTREPRP